MSFDIPDACPECGGDVELAQGFGGTSPYACVDCEHNFSKSDT